MNPIKIHHFINIPSLVVGPKIKPPRVISPYVLIQKAAKIRKHKNCSKIAKNDSMTLK